MPASAIEQSLHQFLTAATGLTELTVEDDLIAAGVIDSLTMMDLLVLIESQFQVRLGFEELTPTSFESVRTLAAVVEGHRSTGGANRAA